MNLIRRKTEKDQTPIYEIKVKGPLEKDWTDWFEGMKITLEDDRNTVISGPVVDQASLYGLLKRVHQLGLKLISFSEVNAEESVTSHKGGK